MANGIRLSLINLQMTSNNQNIILTEGGKEKLIGSIGRLEDRLASIRLRKGEASETGGNAWHDNAEFEELEHQERMLMGELSDLKHKLGAASMVDKKTGDVGTAGLGSTVSIKYLDTGETLTFEIVGYGEGDPSTNKLSYDSPLASCIMGAKLGDEREMELNDSTKRIRVEAIRY